MIKRLLLPLASVAASLALAPSAGAATTPAAVSENWSGYEATSQSATGFSAVSGSWRQPSVNCTAGNQTYSAYWVGLGGGGQSSSALEQVGTQADCTASGQVSDYAWFELVPAIPVRLALKISPGDQIYARTAVSGDQVTLTLSDRTTGQSATRTLTMSNPAPDTSTAEWIAEAPSACVGSTTGNCQVLPLSNFGTVKFSGAYARSGSTVTSAGGLQATNVALDTGQNSAAASALNGSGTNFSVTYGAQTAGAVGGGYASEYSGYGASGYPGYYSSDGGYGYSVYSYPGYGYSVYSYPGYGYAGYGYPGYLSNTPLLPRGLTSTGP